MLLRSILWWHLLWGRPDNALPGKCAYSNSAWPIKEWKGSAIVCGTGRPERMPVRKNWRHGRMESRNVRPGSCLQCGRGRRWDLPDWTVAGVLRQGVSGWHKLDRQRGWWVRWQSGSIVLFSNWSSLAEHTGYWHTSVPKSIFRWKYSWNNHQRHCEIRWGIAVDSGLCWPVTGSCR